MRLFLSRACEDFAVYMRDQRGLSAVTIRNRCWHVEKFLEWLSELNRSFAEVSISDVDAFLSLKGCAHETENKAR